MFLWISLVIYCLLGYLPSSFKLHSNNWLNSDAIFPSKSFFILQQTLDLIVFNLQHLEMSADKENWLQSMVSSRSEMLLFWCYRSFWLQCEHSVYTRSQNTNCDHKNTNRDQKNTVTITKIQNHYHDHTMQNNDHKIQTHDHKNTKSWLQNHDHKRQDHDHKIQIHNDKIQSHDGNT